MCRGQKWEDMLSFLFTLFVQSFFFNKLLRWSCFKSFKEIFLIKLRGSCLLKLILRFFKAVSPTLFLAVAQGRQALLPQVVKFFNGIFLAVKRKSKLLLLAP